MRKGKSHNIGVMNDDDKHEERGLHEGTSPGLEAKKRRKAGVTYRQPSQLEFLRCAKKGIFKKKERINY